MFFTSYSFLLVVPHSIHIPTPSDSVPAPAMPSFLPHYVPSSFLFFLSSLCPWGGFIFTSFFPSSCFMLQCSSSDFFFFFNSFYFGVSQRRILVTPLCGAYTRLDIKIVLQNVSRIDLICLKEHISFSEAYDQFYWKLLPSSRAISLGWKIPGCSNILLKLLKTDLIFLKWKVWDDSSCGHQYLSCSSSVVFYFVLFYSLDLFYWGHIALINFHVNVVKLMFPLQTFLIDLPIQSILIDLPIENLIHSEMNTDIQTRKSY